MKITKSWILTIASFVFAVLAPPLADAGIAITEDQVQHYMLLFFGISGIGAGVSVRKAVRPTPAAPVPIPAVPVPAPVPAPTPPTVPEPIKAQVEIPPIEIDHSVYGYNMPQKPLETAQANAPDYTGMEHDWFQTDLTYVKGVGAVMYTDDPFLWIKAKGGVKIDGHVVRESDKRKVQIGHGTDELRMAMYTQEKDGTIIPFATGEYAFEFGVYFDLKGFNKKGDGKFTLMERG